VAIATEKPTTTQDFQSRRDAIYAEVVRDMRNRSAKQVFATLVEAGIYSKNGHLTKNYRPVKV
jgi:hypothetical protein